MFLCAKTITIQVDLSHNLRKPWRPVGPAISSCSHPQGPSGQFPRGSNIQYERYLIRAVENRARLSFLPFISFPRQLCKKAAQENVGVGG